jgi:hypothetical protein
MTYEEFLEKFASITKYEYDKNDWRRGTPFYKQPKIPGSEHISCEWVTGGVCGGSCWGNDRLRPMSGEPEPDTWSLDTILESVCPEISYIKYKRLLSHLAKYSEYTNYEYYGNSTAYGVKKVMLRELFDWLVAEGMVDVD